MAADPHLGQQHLVIREWAGKLRELSGATGMSLRQLAEHMPWSPSTLSRYLSGERVVDEAWLLATRLIELSEKRGNVVLVETDELQLLYMRARQAYQEQQRAQRNKQDQQAEEPSRGADDPQDTPDDPDDSESRPRRRAVRVFAVVAGVVVVVGAVAGCILWLRSENGNWRANIVGTWSAQHQQYLGVFRFRSPDIVGDTDKATFHEGTSVAIVCQSRHRRQVSDPTTGKSSAVWNQLSDGSWIPDLYTDLPKVTGDDPPLGIPHC